MNTKIKIDFTFPFFYPMIGGAEIYAFELATRLAEKQYDVKVHTPIYNMKNEKLKKYEEVNGIKIFRYKPVFRKYHDYWFWTPKIEKTDILHVTGYNHMCCGLTIYKYRKLFPIAITPIGVSALIEGPKSAWLRKQYDRFMGIYLLKLCKTIIVWANEEKDWCLKNNIDEDKIKKISIGVAEESFYEYDPENIKREYNLKEYLLYLGRIHVDKGVLDLVKAFSLISQKFRNIDLVLAGPDGGCLDEILKLAENLKLGERVKWISTVIGKRKYELVSGCKCLILPSKYELQGIVLVEAMAQGKPVIASIVGGVPDFIKDGYNGLLHEFGDIKTLSEKIELILKSKDLNEKLGKNALVTASSYKWNDIIDEYVKVYNKVLENSEETKNAI